MPLLILLLSFANIATAETIYRLDPHIAPTFQHIELHLDPDADTFTGQTRITLAVTRATLTDSTGDIALAIASAGPEGLSRADLARTITPGEYQLTFEFTGPYNTQAVGLYLVEYEKKRYLFTQFEEIDATRIPMLGRAILQDPLPNGPPRPRPPARIQQHSRRKRDPRRRMETRRLPPQPADAHLPPGHCRRTARQGRNPGLSIPGRIITAADQHHLAGLAAEITPPLLAALETYFDRPYPYAKLDLVAVPDFAFGAMENVETGVQPED